MVTQLSLSLSLSLHLSYRNTLVQMSLNLLYHGVGGDGNMVDVDDSHETNGDDDEVHDEADGVVLMIMLSVDD